jgi:zinc transporter ZupT
MTILIATCILTTAIAIASVFSAGHARLQERALPWIGGLLLGIGVFWILPEIAERRGWLFSLIGMSAILGMLACIDRYLYPICPFCAAGVHRHPVGGAPRPTMALGWPLLLVGCIHSFFDGWMIALPQVSPAGALAAISWGAIVHKIPEGVAIGILAARLTSKRSLAVGTVLLLQSAMAAGGALAVFRGNLDPRWDDIYCMPACALVLLFGLLALDQERRLRGGVAAIRAAAPGLVGCGLAALAGQIWPQ